MIRGEKGSKKGIGMILKFPFSMQKMCLGPGWIKRMERYFQLRGGGVLEEKFETAIVALEGEALMWY